MEFFSAEISHKDLPPHFLSSSKKSSKPVTPLTNTIFETAHTGREESIGTATRFENVSFQQSVFQNITDRNLNRGSKTPNSINLELKDFLNRT